jgi:hypothetical protein
MPAIAAGDCCPIPETKAQFAKVDFRDIAGTPSPN